MALARELVPQIIPNDFNPVTFLCKKLTNTYMASVGLDEGLIQDFENHGNSFISRSFKYSTTSLISSWGCNYMNPLNDICNVSFNWGVPELFYKAYNDYAECVRLSKITPGGNSSVPICATWPFQKGNNTNIFGYNSIGADTIGCHNLYSVLIKPLLPLSDEHNAKEKSASTSYSVDPRDFLFVILALGALGVMTTMLYSIISSRYKRGSYAFFQPRANARTTPKVIELDDNDQEIQPLSKVL